MTALLDVIISAIFGATLLLIILTANDTAMENSAMTFGDRYVQEALLSITQLVEGDYRNMGFGVPDSMDVILQADSTEVSFRVDLPDQNGVFGTVDTLSYRMGFTDELLDTPNPWDCNIYRRVGNQPEHVVGVVTFFHMNFLDKNYRELTHPVPDSLLKNVRFVELSIEVQNQNALFKQQGTYTQGEVEALHSRILWKQTRLALENLDR